MVLKRLLFLGLCYSLILGCGTLQRSSSEDTENFGPRDAAINSGEVSSADVRDQLARPYKSPLGDVPMTDNKHSRMWVNYFLGRGRRHMDLYLARSSRYLPMMKNVLREEGLPEDLVYVALIESGFSPKAHSHANAVGYWQFIHGTGKNFGLRIDGYVDERRDPVLSTRAAAAYFKALYNLFGSWHLSLAAYNTGENRVKSRVMRYYTRDFWELVDRKALPKETRQYVPKFIAAAMIAKAPETYGFNSIVYQEPLEYDAVEATNPISLKLLAARLNVDHEEIMRLNPKFRGDYVPNYQGDKMMIRVPKGYKEVAVAAIPNVQTERPAYVFVDHSFHRVRSGETLGHIARKYRTNVGTIRRLNNLGSRSFLRVGQRLKVPERSGNVRQAVAETAADQKTEAQVASVERVEAEYHTVRRGENLTLIARKYGLTVRELLQINQLSQRSTLRVGQRLKLKNASESTQSDTSRGESSHLVKRGETLTFIAKKYGVTLKNIRAANNLNAKSVIQVGQKLEIPRGRRVAAAPAPKPTHHQVQGGENLTLIANKYGLSVAELKAQNKLGRGSVLHVGQRLNVAFDRVHVVRSGENLSLIANKYKVSVRELVRANDLRQKGLIAAGQALVIPD
jgi:membrane-bound lytic murein transglycosylase D